MKLAELLRSKENGRQERNVNSLVMLAKKLEHDTDEKFWDRSESNGWGKGVGRVGGKEGIVGIDWLAAVDDGVAVSEVVGLGDDT